MKIPLEIVTDNRSLVFDILENDTLTSGDILKMPGGATLQFQSSLLTKSFGAPEVLNFIIEASVNLDINILAAYLYQKVNNKSVKQLTIRRKIITEITETEILQVLEEELSWRHS